MAVANREEVETQLAQHVRHKNVRVLVLFVGVTRLMANARRKGELRYAVESLSRYLHLRVRNVLHCVNLLVLFLYAW